MNYYKDPFFLQFVSNSELGNFKKAYYGINDEQQNLQAIFDFGSLVDAMVTEPEKLNWDSFSMQTETDIVPVVFDYNDWEKAKQMSESLLADPVVQTMLKVGNSQHIVLRREFPYSFDGNQITMPTRCKFDFLAKKLDVAVDIKTTSCATAEAFLQSMDTFDYFRQGAIYMDLARVNKMWYIAVSKKKNKYGKYPVFKVAIKRGDKNYLKGWYRYNKLGFLYKLMIYDFKPQLNLINI